MIHQAFLRKHGVKLWVQHREGRVVQPEDDKRAEASKAPGSKRKHAWTGVHGVRVLPTIQAPDLAHAAAVGDAALATRLLQEGHDIEHKHLHNRTALFEAASYGQARATSVLLSRIYDEDLPTLDGVDATDVQGLTPYMEAAKQGHLHSVKQLVEMEVERANEDDADRTALFLAAYNDHTGVVEFLVGGGDGPSVSVSVSLFLSLSLCC